MILLLIASILGYALEAFWLLFLNSMYPQLLLIFGILGISGIISIRQIVTKGQDGIFHAVLSIAISGFSILFILVVKIID